MNITIDFKTLTERAPHLSIAGFMMLSDSFKRREENAIMNQIQIHAAYTGIQMSMYLNRLAMFNLFPVITFEVDSEQEVAAFWDILDVDDRAYKTIVQGHMHNVLPAREATRITFQATFTEILAETVAVNEQFEEQEKLKGDNDAGQTARLH